MKKKCWNVCKSYYYICYFVVSACILKYIQIHVSWIYLCVYQCYCLVSSITVSLLLSYIFFSSFMVAFCFFFISAVASRLDGYTQLHVQYINAMLFNYATYINTYICMSVSQQILSVYSMVMVMVCKCMYFVCCLADINLY